MSIINHPYLTFRHKKKPVKKMTGLSF